jgi:hypothetical protein
LANAKEYNDHLHDEIHQLHNRLHPYIPPRVVEMDLDEDEHRKEHETPAKDDDAIGDDGDVSNLDSDHDE